MNKYRVQSHRMPHWDYSGNGTYFITMVKQNCEHNLGELILHTSENNAVLKLFDFVLIIQNEWHRSFEILKELTLPKNQYQFENNPPQKPPLFRKPQSLSSFIAGFKSAVNSKIDDYIDENNLNIPRYNRNNHFFQPDYHDRIIRDGDDYRFIKRYIQNNPARWINDKLNPFNQ